MTQTPAAGGWRVLLSAQASDYLSAALSLDTGQRPDGLPTNSSGRLGEALRTGPGGGAGAGRAGHRHPVGLRLRRGERYDAAVAEAHHRVQRCGVRRQEPGEAAPALPTRDLWAER
jgi:hypothetical protein